MTFTGVSNESFYIKVKTITSEYYTFGEIAYKYLV